jgi:hypothetical protein
MFLNLLLSIHSSIIIIYGNIAAKIIKICHLLSFYVAFLGTNWVLSLESHNL